MKEGNIVKLNKCTSDHFIAHVVITAKKDGPIKIAMDAKPMNAQIYKNQYQMPNLLEQLDVAAQIINPKNSDSYCCTSLDLKQAFSQLQLSELLSSHCYLKTCVENLQAHIVLRQVFTALLACQKNFRRPWTILYKTFR